MSPFYQHGAPIEGTQVKLFEIQFWCSPWRILTAYVCKTKHYFTIEYTNLIETNSSVLFQSPSSSTARFLFRWLETISDAVILFIFLDSHSWNEFRLSWPARNSDRSIWSKRSVSLLVSWLYAFWELSMMRRNRLIKVCNDKVLKLKDEWYFHMKFELANLS